MKTSKLKRSVYTHRPDSYILNDRHYVCDRHHTCAEVSSKPNTQDGDQTCKKSRCFDTRKPCLNCSFQNGDTQGFNIILAINKGISLKIQKHVFFISSKVFTKELCKHYLGLWCHAREGATPKHWNKPFKLQKSTKINFFSVSF